MLATHSYGATFDFVQQCGTILLGHRNILTKGWPAQSDKNVLFSFVNVEELLLNAALPLAQV